MEGFEGIAAAKEEHGKILCDLFEINTVLTLNSIRLPVKVKSHKTHKKNSNE